MITNVSFVLDGQIHTIDFKNTPWISPTTTVLQYLRSLPNHKGTKEGCAEGDCGACTVVLGEVENEGRIRFKHVDSCLVFLPMIHGKQLLTVESLSDGDGDLHPVQKAMVESNGSQCGYCTPGIVMSLFSLYKQHEHPSRQKIDDYLTGNLCRCTGYRPIIEAASRACVHNTIDRFSSVEKTTSALLKSIPSGSLHVQTGKQHYYRPASISEALGLRREHPEAVLVCGGTDVALRITKKHELLQEVIDLGEVDKLRKVSESQSSLSIGAAVTLSEAMPLIREDFQALYEMLAVFGSRQIRNLATFGGNLGTASPVGDTLPVLMAYHATVVLESLTGKREVPIEKFFTGYRKTACQTDEIITTLILPKPPKNSRVKSYKISKRKDLDISTVSAGFGIQFDGDRTVESITLAYGGMAERTKRAEKVEQFITGKLWNRDVVDQAMSRLESDFNPISDVRGSALMRRIAARNLLLKFWSETRSNEE